MDKAVIIGVFEGLGFLFCKRILEEGIEVEGIHLNVAENDSEIEEKRLQIGRNANFTEWESRNFDFKLLERKGIVVFVDLYSLFMKECEMKLLESEDLRKILNQFQSEAGKMVLLLPISLLSKSGSIHSDPKWRGIIDLKKQKHTSSIQFFYLPPIWGQSESDNASSSQFGRGHGASEQRDHIAFSPDDVVDAMLDVINEKKDESF